MEIGIALYTPDELDYFKDALYFDRLEVPGEMLDAPEKLIAFAEEYELDVQIRELLPRNVISGLSEASPRVLQDLLKLFDTRCEIIREAGFAGATLTTEPVFSSADDSFDREMQDILLCMRSIAFRKGVELFYELRLPESFDGALEQTRKFLRSNTLASRLLIDFHPHEPRGFEILPQALEKVPFQRGAWRISFEVASCNYLSLEAVKRIAEYSRKERCEEDFMIFAPGNGAGEENYHQLNMLAKSFMADQDTAE